MKSFPSADKFSAFMKDTLRGLLAERALRVAEPGESFTLSTGRKSNFYFNCKPVTLSSDGAPLTADAFLDKLKSFPEKVTAVGGRTLIWLSSVNWADFSRPHGVSSFLSMLFPCCSFFRSIWSAAPRSSDG